MKKSWKICMLVGGVMLVSGVVISLISLEVKGAMGVLSDLTGGSYRPSGETGSAVVSLSSDGASALTFSEQEQELAAGAQRLDIDFTSGPVTVQMGEAFSVQLGPKIAPYARYQIDNGTIKLWDTINRRGFRFWKEQRLSSDMAVLITLPKGLEYQFVGLEVGDGTIRVADLTSDTMELSCGAGTAELENVTLRKGDFGCGAGRLTAKDLTVTERFDFSAGVGDSDIEGDLRGKLVFEGGVGSVNARLKGTREDYRISSSTGVGTLRIDGDSYGSFGSGYSDSGKDAPNAIEVSCGVGNVSIDFEG